MTAEQLRGIEEALRLKLPASYREVAAAPPFDPARYGRVYWLYDDPDSVIGATLAPMAGLYEGAAWRDTFLVIGQGAAGDEYLMDTALDVSPVYCLSHEDHSLVAEFPDLAAYLAYWWEEVALSERAEAERRPALARQQREAIVAVGIVGASILLILIMLVVGLIYGRK